MPIKSLRAGCNLQLCALALAVAVNIGAAERRTSFNEGWRFHKGDAAGAEQPAFDDAGWRALDLPHDWAIEGPFDSKHNPETGGLPIYGTAWYRKHFTVDSKYSDRKIFFEVEGAHVGCQVYINGTFLEGK